MPSELFNCPECGGNGIDDDFADGQCPECDGTGMLTIEDLRSQFSLCAEDIINARRARQNPTIRDPARSHRGGQGP